MVLMSRCQMGRLAFPFGPVRSTLTAPNLDQYQRFLPAPEGLRKARPTRMGRVLVQSSDRELLALLRVSLDPLQWTMTVADDAEEFAFRLQDGTHDVVVIDIDRPDGMTALTASSAWPAVVIAITTDLNDARAITAMDFGADAVYTKPLSPDLLNARLLAAVRCVRRHDGPEAERYVFGSLEVDLRDWHVAVNGRGQIRRGP